MAVTNPKVKTELLPCDGTETEFAFNFPILSEQELEVRVYDSEGVPTVKTYGTDYTVVPDLSTFESGGEVIFVEPPDAGSEVLLVRKSDIKQYYDPVSGGGLSSSSIERALDRAIMILQESSEKISRSLVQDPYATEELILPAPSELANHFLAFDAAGFPIAADPTSVPVTTFMQTLLDDEDVATARATLEVDPTSLAPETVVVIADSLRCAESVTLTNHDNSLEPAIAAGSWIEVNGVLREFPTETSIAGSASAGLNYIKFVADVPTWTAAAPTWSDAKQGWYNGNDRYLFSCYYDGTNYLDKQKLKPEQNIPDFLKPHFISSLAEDLTLNGISITQKLIYCRNLHVTANTTVRVEGFYIEGNLIIDSGVTLSFEPYWYRDYSGAYSNWPAYIMDGINQCIIGWDQTSTANTVIGGKGALGGGNGTVVASGSSKRAGGGGSIGASGGSNTSTGGAGGSALWGNINVGGKGGDNPNRASGAGAGPCGMGGANYYSATDSWVRGARGGAFTSFMVKGDMINSGAIKANGEDGTGYEGPGGGGLIILMVFGNTCQFGTIETIGGDHGVTSYGSGSGGGGHIHAVGKTSDFTGLDVSAGVPGSNGETGGTGTTVEINLNTDPDDMFGCQEDDVYTHVLMRLLRGVYV